MDSTISLRGFDILDPAELEEVQKILSKEFNKISRIEPESLIIELKQHKHAKEYIHEIKCVLFIKDKRLSSQSADKNLYKAIKIALTKLLSEIKHKLKK